jgi:C4-dicarboxylate-specific signal transduction histidine kinase
MPALSITRVTGCKSNTSFGNGLFNRRASRPWLAVIFLFSLLLCVLQTGALHADPLSEAAELERIKVGVLAFRGAEHATHKWSPTIDYLNDALHGERFLMLPLDLESLEDAVSSGLVDFVITNPGNYVSLESRYGASRIATLQNNYKGSRYTRYGAVIISRKDNTSIKTLADLRGARFMAISPRALGGYQMAWLQMRAAGIEPEQDFKEILYSGFPQDKVVYAVLNGAADAGTVRAETLARMGKEKKIDLGKIRVLNAQRSDDYPFTHSTALYPEWAFAKLRHTSDDLAREVSIALLSFVVTSSEDNQIGYAWTIPLDYSPVHELFRQLKIAPYDELGKISLTKVLKKYAVWIISFLLLLVLMASTISYIARINRRLNQSQEQLTRQQQVLEERVTERTMDLNKANLALQQDIEIRHQAEQALRNSKAILQSIHEITTDHSLDFDEKIQQLLIAGCEHFQLEEGRFTRIDNDIYRVIYHYDAGKNGFMPPAELDINQTICNLTVKQSEILAIKQAEDIDADSRIIFEKNNIQCYVGTPVYLNDDLYGTLCFSSSTIRTDDFSPVDHDILQLISQWVSGELERQRITSMATQHQRELEHAARLGTLGELATGLAHELNQPLTAISNYLKGFQRRLNKPEIALDQISPAIDKAVTEAERAANIIKQMRELIQKRELQRENLNVNDIIENAVDIIRSSDESDSPIDYHVDLDSNCPILIADRVQIEQVLINLLLNSRDALHGCNNPGRINVSSYFNENHIILEVSDNGPGVEDTDINKIFSPFNTSKSEGLGLGLSICRTIIESYHGNITASNSAGGGLKVKIHLPYSNE